MPCSSIPGSCRSPTSTSSSRCRRRSARSRSRTRRWSTASCSAPPPRRCASSPPIRAISERKSAGSRCGTAGPGAAASPAYPLHRPWRRPRTGRDPLDRLPAGVLPVGQGPGTAVPPPVSAASRQGLRRGRAPLLRRSRDPGQSRRLLRPLRRLDWVVYAKRPFGGPEQVLAYLGRYTHRVAIANSRLVGMADGKVSFRWKDYHQAGRDKVMTLDAGEFIRRFLLHVLPAGFHRIRHFGFLANRHRAGPARPLPPPSRRRASPDETAAPTPPRLKRPDMRRPPAATSPSVPAAAACGSSARR